MNQIASPGRFSPQGQKRWLPVQNLSGEAIPPFAVMQINNDSTVDSGLATNEIEGVLVYNVIKPNDDSQNKTNQATILFNGPTTIPVGGFGHGTQDFPVMAKAGENSFQLTLADTLGVISGDWGINPNQSGYRPIGNLGISPVLPSTVTGVVMMSPDLTNAGLLWFQQAPDTTAIAATSLIDIDPLSSGTDDPVNGWKGRGDLAGAPMELTGSGIFQVNFSATIWSDDSSSDNADLDIALYAGHEDGPVAGSAGGDFSADESIDIVVGGKSMRSNIRDGVGYGTTTLYKGTVDFSCILRLFATQENRLYLVNRSSVTVDMSHANFTAHKIGEIP